MVITEDVTLAILLPYANQLATLKIAIQAMIRDIKPPVWKHVTIIE
ncbi:MULTISPECIES: hypothetical protein [unclassified Methylophaga]|nr:MULTISPECIES: hypothetical protein [unclassified Methylophaga]MDX1751215.1 hypothetical protein [Methylophaga sp.]